MEPLIQFNTSRTSIIYQLPSDPAAAKKRIEFGQPCLLWHSRSVQILIRLCALHVARLMRCKMCVRACEPERRHLGRLCVSVSCFPFLNQTKRIGKIKMRGREQRWPSRKLSEMRVPSSSEEDEAADGNRGIKRGWRITWQSGNEKWEVMKADKRERWRQRRERERESCCCLTFTLSLPPPPRSARGRKMEWRNDGEKKGWR